MNWKAKCLAFYVMNYSPGGAAMHAWFQKRITRRFFPRLDEEYLSGYLFNVRNFEPLNARTPATALEFGAGANLLTSLLLSSIGAEKILVFDIKRLATIEQVNDAIRQLRNMNYPNASNPDWPAVRDLDADLSTKYRIAYIAPGDARRTRLPEQSVDFIYSTSTLEHIPKQDMILIFAECRRILKPSGRLSFIIDYHDHYATADASISRFNFLRYSSSAWKWFNPPNHFQNRLRHSDYESIFRESGFRWLSNRHIVPQGSVEELRAISPADDFRGYSPEDLAGLNGLFLLENDG